MDSLSVILCSIALPILFLFLIFLLFVIKIFTGKSMNDPKYAPVKGTVFNQLLYFNKLYDYQTQIARKVPTFRLLGLTNSTIFTTDARNIEHIVKTEFEKYAKGEQHGEILRDLLGQGMFAVDGDKWKEQRRFASYEFSTKVLRDSSCPVFRNNAAKLVRAVSKLTASGQVIEFQNMMMKCTMDSIFKVACGINLNCMDWSSNEEGSRFMKAFDNANESVNSRFIDPLWMLKRSLNVGSEASLKKNIKIIDHFIHNVISTKKKLLATNPDRNDKEDVLSRFLTECEKNPETMTDQYLRDTIFGFLVAGKDTTANALTWFFYMLCKNPLIQDKVAQEVMQITRANDNLNIDDFITSIADATLDKMHYLHASLSETLRLYPAVPVNGRCSLDDDILPDGHKVKKGDEVNYLTYVMGRMPYIWGEDAEDFRPERWLKDGVFQPESPFKFTTFHGGPRVCLGKDFAYRQMKIFSIALIRYFRFKLADDTKDATYEITFTLHMKGGLHLCAVPRTSSET